MTQSHIFFIALIAIPPTVVTIIGIVLSRREFRSAMADMQTRFSALDARLAALTDRSRSY